ncbi:helix-turn-helix transcriptional regulator [Clostridium felsineum]|uniref:helix-turn-helix transcriptional regulator n=1 Tax=Clostridium felsineum TaxID=36839 RepID=UPI00098C2280|nr:transcriptional regulator [Clostridium felsineum]URZ03331.1 hypothetical protein CLAUR_033770 [Clostridium felsineum]
MSKFSNILKMIILLQSRGKMKIKDISDILEVDERMVRKYKEDLEKAGVYVESTRGVDGGYELKNFDYLMKADITEEEQAALELAVMQLESNKFAYLKNIKGLTDKINAIKNYKNKVQGNMNYFVKTSDFSVRESEKKKVIDINVAVLTRKKLKIKYFSLTSGDSTRIIRPYIIMSYKNSLYIIAYCEKRNEIRHFKVSRIKEYKILNDNFIIQQGFSIEQYMKNNFGIYKDGIFNVKLQIYYPMSYIVSEKVWVKNQKITCKEDKSIIFEASMEGKTEIVAWILSMGRNVKVIEPEELKDTIRKELESAMNYYKQS